MCIRDSPSAAVHRNLCTACKRNGARDFGAGFGENGLSGGRCNSENRTDLLNYGRHQASETGARNANRVHNSGVTVTNDPDLLESSWFTELTTVHPDGSSPG